MKLRILAMSLAAASVASTAWAASSVRDPQLEQAVKEGAQMRAALKASAINVTGDDDSFGRSVNFLGLLAGDLTLADDCSQFPSCVTLNPAPAATAFSANRLANILIPGGSTHSLICQWQTPLIVYDFRNLTGVFQPKAEFKVAAVYTLHNTVLDDASLINPVTGLPFGGELIVSISSVRHTRSMQQGDMESERETGTRSCIGGLVSRDALINGYGLSSAQADKFFLNDTDVTLGIEGNAKLVGFATITFGTRFVGD